jgi:hypothetical protein
MSYVIYDTETLLLANLGKGWYQTETAAKAAITRWKKSHKDCAPNQYAYTESVHYNTFISPKKVVHNLMSGKATVIDANTPLCCDPSSETYWSM